jgi:hypothetical protein
MSLIRINIPFFWNIRLRKWIIGSYCLLELLHIPEEMNLQLDLYENLKIRIYLGCL